MGQSSHSRHSHAHFAWTPYMRPLQFRVFEIQEPGHAAIVWTTLPTQHDARLVAQGIACAYAHAGIGTDRAWFYDCVNAAGDAIVTYRQASCDKHAPPVDVFIQTMLHR